MIRDIEKNLPHVATVDPLLELFYLDMITSEILMFNTMFDTVLQGNIDTAMRQKDRYNRACALRRH